MKTGQSGVSVFPVFPGEGAAGEGCGRFLSTCFAYHCAEMLGVSRPLWSLDRLTRTVKLKMSQGSCFLLK